MPDHNENVPPAYHGFRGSARLTIRGQSNPASGHRSAASTSAARNDGSTIVSLFTRRTKSAPRSSASAMPQADPCANPRLRAGRWTSISIEGTDAPTDASRVPALSMRKTVVRPVNETCRKDSRQRAVTSTGPQWRTTMPTWGRRLVPSAWRGSETCTSERIRATRARAGVVRSVGIRGTAGTALVPFVDSHREHNASTEPTTEPMYVGPHGDVKYAITARATVVA